MQNIRVFHAVGIGDSHLRKGIPCQDAASSFEDNENQIYIGVVSDGHGGKDYFRSDIGSKLLVEITVQNILVFLKQSESFDLFQSSFVSRNTITSGAIPVSEDNNDRHQIKSNNDALNQLFKSIIAGWQQGILQDWSNNTPDRDELLSYGISDSMINEFFQGKNLSIAYGCTLIAFARTQNFWFAFQIGDGKSIGFDCDMNALEPIPADIQCIGSLTTSMCEDNAFDNFRYAYGNEIPCILMIGSDGLDGYFSNIEEFAIEPLKGLYRSVVDSFITKEYYDGLKELNDSLPILSKRGVTQDDMSIAGWIDFSKKEQIANGIKLYKKVAAEQKLKETDEKLERENKELHEFEENLKVKSGEISSLNDQLNAIDFVLDQSQSDIINFQNKIITEEENQKSLLSKKDALVEQKHKIDVELAKLSKLKENKIELIQKIEFDKNKIKRELDSF